MKMETETPKKHQSVPCIIRSDLHRQLQRAAQVRSTLVIVLIIPIIFIGFALMPASLANDQSRSWIPILICFGSFFGLSWVVTRLYCVRKVVCPNCGHSLWKCGTGNFKPRRMKVRKDATACPECGIHII